MEYIEDILRRYLPEEVVPICTRWIVQKNIQLKITRGRASRLGDYIPVRGGLAHRITINHDLNPYAFLITFIHEVAHLFVFEKYGTRPLPHGKEWKHQYRELLSWFMVKKIFPQDLEDAIIDSLKNPGAGSCTDARLTRLLMQYNPGHAAHIVHLETLQEGDLFRLSHSRNRSVYSRGKRIRTRFRCKEKNTGTIFLIHGIAEVEKAS